jgi:ethanolamine utilization microcompartment shell protein EutS
MADAPLILTPKELGFSIVNPDRDVLVHLDFGQWEQYVGRPIAIRMTPLEARRIAQTLARKADEAEAGLPSQS